MHVHMSSSDNSSRSFVSIGMFIVDEFSFADGDGKPTGKTMAAQIGGGGTYASIGARIWLPPSKVGMIIDRGHDFPGHIQEALDAYGSDMWLYRDDPNRGTTRALNVYRGEYRGFEYLTPKLRITPHDLDDTKLARPDIVHFICSPSRAAVILSEIKQDEGWHPTTVYEPIPDRCVPEELPSLQKVLSDVSILSPNAEEALSLLSLPEVPTKERVEEACRRFLDMGVGSENSGKVVDVTGAGNSFLGGLGAGLVHSQGDVRQATLYATVSASFTIEQAGLPCLTLISDETGTPVERWNGDSPHDRLQALQDRLGRKLQSE
ncbi:Ribokinase-like protein [Ganoderma leucocontextum]|nr:Ribokinase-like protein [Ganoderma leucocontextum]